MSKFHASVRDLLEDIYSFLAVNLQNEVLSSSTLTERERLLTQMSCFQKEYPELQLNFALQLHADGNKYDPSSYSPTSPVPYIDMNGLSQLKVSLLHMNASSEDSPYDCFPTQKSENQSIAESEDYMSDDAKNLPYVAASELAVCDKAGYLDKKKRESIKGWLNPFKRRWCAIKEGVLYYYEKTTDRKQRGSILLSGYEARPLPETCNEGKKYNHCFELVCPGKRTYQFSASSEKDMLQWITAVEKNCMITYSGKSSLQYQSNMSSSSYSASKESENAYETEDIYETVLEEDDGEEETDETIGHKLENSVVDEEEYSDVDTVPTQEQMFNYNEWYVCLWDSVGDDDTELSFTRGDHIRIVSKEYDSFAWWIGELQGKVGFVPKSYLMEAYEAY